MKYYEIDAIKSDSRLVERFFENGKRFIKFVPFNPKLLGALQEQFKHNNTEVELKNGWIVVTRKGHDEQLANAARQVVGDKVITVEDIAAEEKKLLESAGYKVTVVQMEVDE